MNPSDAAECSDVLSILQILHRKDPKRIVVVIPFLDQSTQDRVEFHGDWETIAQVDTFGKRIGNYTTLTYDLHSEQTRWAFHDLRCKSLVLKLWKRYTRSYPDAVPVFPDDGAAKRFGRLLDIQNPVTFRKKRDDNDKTKRLIATDDEIEKGREYVIIDDLVRSGGTMRAVATYLYEHGASAVDALFAHAPYERTTARNLSIFRNISTSDSCPRSVPREHIDIRIADEFKSF